MQYIVRHEVTVIVSKQGKPEILHLKLPGGTVAEDVGNTRPNPFDLTRKVRLLRPLPVHGMDFCLETATINTVDLCPISQ